MDMVKRLLAIFLVATAVATALNLILTPVYHNGSAAYPVWEILNWFLAAAVLVSLVVSILRRLALRSEKSQHPRVRANQHDLLRGHRADHAVLLGVVLDLESQ